MKPELSSQYADLERWHWWFRSRRKILESILERELGQRRKALRLLSLGCGPAEGMQWLCGQTGAGGMVVGLDMDTQFGKTGLGNLHYVRGRVEGLPFVTDSFDAVFALDVLEHLDDDAGALRQACSLVKPGGILMATVPAFPSLWGRQDVINLHRRRYTRRTLRETFAQAGVDSPRLYYFNSFLLPMIAAVRWSRRVLHQKEGTDFNDNRPGLLNDVLSAIFSIESRFIGRIPFPAGVSLLAIHRVRQKH